MNIQPLNSGPLLAPQPVTQPNPVAPVQDVAKVEPSGQSGRSSFEEQQSAADSQQRNFGAEDLRQVLQVIQSAINTAHNQLTFAVDRDSGRTLVKIVNRETNELIKQIPAEEVLRIAKVIDTLKGLLFDQKI